MGFHSHGDFFLPQIPFDNRWKYKVSYMLTSGSTKAGNLVSTNFNQV